uniref:hypothetical protein n=1 Tax=Okeania sp. SIO2F4 TaxID=2607790 RepID=UPI0025CC4BCB|nr:hypothetical protein [Okeania sp. SIO2F4]
MKKSLTLDVIGILNELHQLCNLADNIFVEDINFNSWSRGIVRKQSLDSGIGQFINEVLPFVCWR